MEQSGKKTIRRRLPAIPPMEHEDDRPKRKPAQPEKFDGTTSVEAFLEHFHTCAKYNRWDEEDMYVQLKLCLKGSAAGLLKDCRQDIKTFSALEEKIQQRFDAKGREASFRAQLRVRRRGKHETLQELYISISELMHQAFPGRSTEHKDIIACEAFIDALDDASLEQRVKDKMPDNLDEAFRLAVILEANSRGSELRVQERQKAAGNRYETRAVFEAKDGNGEKEEVENRNKEEINALSKAMEKLCKTVTDFISEGQKRSNEPTLNSGGNARKRTGSCYICQDLNHWAAQCPMREAGGRTFSQVAAVVHDGGQGRTADAYAERYREPENRPRQEIEGDRRRTEEEKRCYRCRGLGHIARTCPNRQSDESLERNGPRNGVRVNAMNRAVGRGTSVYLKMWFGNTSWLCLLDTGCEKSIIPKKLIGRMQLNESTEELYAANGTKIATVGSVNIPLHVEGLILPVEAVVTEHVREPILGADWIKEHGCVIDLAQSLAAIRGKTLKLEAAEGPVRCRMITARPRSAPTSRSTSPRQVAVKSKSEASCVWKPVDGASVEMKEPLREGSRLSKELEKGYKEVMVKCEEGLKAAGVLKAQLELLYDDACRMTDERDAAGREVQSARDIEKEILIELLGARKTELGWVLLWHDVARRLQTNNPEGWRQDRPWTRTNEGRREGFGPPLDLLDCSGEEWSSDDDQDYYGIGQLFEERSATEDSTNLSEQYDGMAIPETPPWMLSGDRWGWSDKEQTESSSSETSHC